MSASINPLNSKYLRHRAASSGPNQEGEEGRGVRATEETGREAGRWPGGGYGRRKGRGQEDKKRLWLSRAPGGGWGAVQNGGLKLMRTHAARGRGRPHCLLVSQSPIPRSDLPTGFKSLAVLLLGISQCPDQPGRWDRLGPGERSHGRSDGSMSSSRATHLASQGRPGSSSSSPEMGISCT